MCIYKVCLPFEVCCGSITSSLRLQVLWSLSSFVRETCLSPRDRSSLVQCFSIAHRHGFILCLFTVIYVIHICTITNPTAKCSSQVSVLGMLFILHFHIGWVRSNCCCFNAWVMLDYRTSRAEREWCLLHQMQSGGIARQLASSFPRDSGRSLLSSCSCPISCQFPSPSPGRCRFPFAQTVKSQSQKTNECLTVKKNSFKKYK